MKRILGVVSAMAVLMCLSACRPMEYVTSTILDFTYIGQNSEEHGHDSVMCETTTIIRVDGDAMLARLGIL